MKINILDINDFVEELKEQRMKHVYFSYAFVKGEDDETYTYIVLEKYIEPVLLRYSEFVGKGKDVKKLEEKGQKRRTEISEILIEDEITMREGYHEE